MSARDWTIETGFGVHVTVEAISEPRGLFLIVGTEKLSNFMQVNPTVKVYFDAWLP